MKNLKIKVTGEGTKEEIISALKALIQSIENPDEKFEEAAYFEDETLFSEVDPK